MRPKFSLMFLNSHLFPFRSAYDPIKASRVRLSIVTVAPVQLRTQQLMLVFIYCLTVVMIADKLMLCSNKVRALLEHAQLAGLDRLRKVVRPVVLWDSGRRRPALAPVRGQTSTCVYL